MGWGASMGNNLSPLDIRSHALFLLDFVLWKWLTPFLVSKQMRKVPRLEKVEVKPNKHKAYTSDARLPLHGMLIQRVANPLPHFLKGCPDSL